LVNINGGGVLVVEFPIREVLAEWVDEFWFYDVEQADIDRLPASARPRCSVLQVVAAPSLKVILGRK
jgi:hypothetical protein